MKRLVIIILILLMSITIALAGLPTANDLKTMDYSFQGQPFVDIPAKESINLETMDYAFQGQPFVTILSTEELPPEVKTNILFIFTNF